MIKNFEDADNILDGNRILYSLLKYKRNSYTGIMKVTFG